MSTTYDLTRTGHTGELIGALPECFRFADLNPLAGEPYLTSPMELLPRWAARELPVTSWAWDALVDAGASALVVDPYRSISLDWLRELVRLRPGVAPPRDVCVDCWGSTVGVDSDGSLTGTVGALVLCACAGNHWIGVA